MAASTTIPTAKAMPAKDITLIERPRAAMATKEPITETGMAIATMTVGRQERRNSNSTIDANKPPIIMFD